VRYSCLKCGRVFHLDTHIASPCPLCGVMLERDSEARADGATSDDGDDKAVAVKDADPWVLEEPIERTRPATVIASSEMFGLRRDTEDQTALRLASSEVADEKGPWHAAPAQTAGKVEAHTPEGTSPYSEDGVGNSETKPPVRRKARKEDGMSAEGAPHQGRMRTPAAVMPALTVGNFTIHAAAAIAFAAVLMTVLLVWRPAFLFGHPSARAAAVTSARAALVRLKKELAQVKAKNRDLESDKMLLRDETLRLTTQTDDLRREADTLAERMRRRTDSIKLMLAAVQLIERRSALDRALGTVNAALRLAPDLGDAHRVKGKALAAIGRPEDALEAFDAAHEIACAAGLPGDIEAMVLAGEICLTDLDNLDGARRYYAKALGLKRDVPLAQVAEARRLFIEGDLDRAVAKAQKARQDDGTIALAPLILGEIAFKRCLLESGTERSRLLGSAGAHLDEAMKLDPNSARACLVRGRVLIEESRSTNGTMRFGLQRFDQMAQADRLLSKASGLSPRLPEAYVALAELRLRDGPFRDLAGARDFAQEAVKLTKRRDVKALATLAAAQAAAGRPMTAARTIEEALAADPESKDLRSALREYRQGGKALAP